MVARHRARRAVDVCTAPDPLAQPILLDLATEAAVDDAAPARRRPVERVAIDVTTHRAHLPPRSVPIGGAPLFDSTARSAVGAHFLSPIPIRITSPFVALH